MGVQLVQAGVRPYDWPPIFITHHHSDHTIDLGHVLITRWIVGQNAPLAVYGPAGTRRQVDKLSTGWTGTSRCGAATCTSAGRPRCASPRSRRALSPSVLAVSAFLVAQDPVLAAFRYRFDADGASRGDLLVQADSR